MVSSDGWYLWCDVRRRDGDGSEDEDVYESTKAWSQTAGGRSWSSNRKPQTGWDGWPDTESMVHVFVLVYTILNMVHAFYLSYYTSRLSYLLKFEGMVISWSSFNLRDSLFQYPSVIQDLHEHRNFLEMPQLSSSIFHLQCRVYSLSPRLHEILIYFVRSCPRFRCPRLFVAGAHISTRCIGQVIVLVYTILNMVHAFYLSYYTSRLSYLLKPEGMVISWSSVTCAVCEIHFFSTVSHSKPLRTQEFPEWSRPTSKP